MVTTDTFMRIGKHVMFKVSFIKMCNDDFDKNLFYHPGFSFTPQNRLFLSVGMCSSQNKQFRADMEDTMKFVDCFGRQTIELFFIDSRFLFV